MMPAPLVSVLLPARNAARTLAESLASLGDQTLTRWECLVVDDGSTDDTAAIAAAAARHDARFRVLRFGAWRGIVSALNAAAAQARAPYLARQDADDRSAPERLARLIAALDGDPTLGAVASRVRIFPADDVPPGLHEYAAWLDATLDPDEIAREIWVESPLPHPATMMRRDAFARCGGYQEGPWPEDYDLWLRMHLAGWRFLKLRTVLYDWRHHAHRLSFTDPRYAPAAFLACKLRHLSPRLSGREVWIWGAGRDGRRLARALIERDVRPAGFIDIDPRKIGRTRLGLPVEAPESLASSAGPERDAPDRCAAARPDSPGSRLILVAVGTRGARGLIRERLAQLRLREPADFLCLH